MKTRADHRPGDDTQAGAPVTRPCPHCGTPCTRTRDNPWRPFCSQRCKLIDLGDWLDEQHRVPDTPDFPDQQT